MKPDITAVIRLYQPEEGGRKSATPPNQFSCLFEYGGESFDCRLLLDDIGPIQPGEKKIVPIKFLNWSLVAGRLKSGDLFHLREVREIAEGQVQQVISSIEVPQRA